MTNSDNTLLQQHGITLWDTAKIADFRHALLAWYDVHQRDLPWRRTRDPYAIWVSETMLQQTQVATVIPYYLNFMTRFPTIDALAAADEQDLLKAWEGLGYYSRVRNLQKGAQQVCTQYNGIVPDSVTDLKRLHGIGPYTAGAIASIAFQQPEPAIDGNVMRIMSRLFEIELDIADTKNRKVFEALVRQLIDPVRPGDFNQALMDLGSDICSAKNPRPEDSPIKAFNAAYHHGTMARYPIKKKKQPPVISNWVALVLSNQHGQLAMVQRPADGLLAQLWTYPLISGETLTDDLWDDFLDTHTLKPVTPPETLGQVQHVFTHRKWLINVYHANVITSLPAATPLHWVSAEELMHLPTPTVQQKMAALTRN